MTFSTFTSRAAAGLVALVAGYASYRHIYDVATGAGEHESVAAVLPLSIDGLILVGTLAMLDDKRHQRRPRKSARVALVFGVVATIAANIASAEPTVTARLVAAVPAVSFLLAVEVLSRVGRSVPAPVDSHRPDEPLTGSDPLTWMYPEPIGPEPASEPLERVKPRRVTARALTAADRVKAAHRRWPDATHERIAEAAGCSVATVKRHRPARDVSGSPSGDGAAKTVPGDRVNGVEVPELAEVVR